MDLFRCQLVSITQPLDLFVLHSCESENLSDWTSDTESESTFEMSSFNELGRIERSVFLLNMQLFL